MLKSGNVWNTAHGSATDSTEFISIYIQLLEFFTVLTRHLYTPFGKAKKDEKSVLI